MSEERPLDKQQLDAVFAHLLPFAHQTLEKYGEFFPFGAAMRRDGEIQSAMAQTASERPPSQGVIDLLRKGFREERAKLIAVGICYDVRIRSVPDGTARTRSASRSSTPAASQ